MDTKCGARVLRAFGDPTRLRILALLARHPANVSEMVRTLRRRQPAISRHLDYLHTRGFVDSEQAGSNIVYRLSRPTEALPRQMLATLLRALEAMPEIAADLARAKSAATRA